MAKDVRAKLGPLELRTPILLRELGAGATLAHPLADPSAVCLAEEQSLTEQRIYLESLLSSAPPQVVAAFAAPARGELVEIGVQLEREDLPARLQLRQPLSIACLVLPHGRDRWVVVPSLGHTFHVGAGENLEQAVRAEVRRMVGALAPTPAEWLALLPPRSQRLETLELSIDRGDRLADLGFHASRGARPLKRTIEERVFNRLAVLVAAHPGLENATIPVLVADDPHATIFDRAELGRAIVIETS